MKELRYFLINGFFAYSIYAGLVLNQNGFLNIALFIGWGTSITSFMLWHKESIKVMSNKINDKTIPEWIDITFDLCIVATFVYYGYIWLPLFYLIHIANLHNARKEAKKLKTENN